MKRGFMFPGRIRVLFLPWHSRLDFAPQTRL
jgi:hypothetical protein